MLPVSYCCCVFFSLYISPTFAHNAHILYVKINIYPQQFNSQIIALPMHTFTVSEVRKRNWNWWYIFWTIYIVSVNFRRNLARCYTKTKSHVSMQRRRYQMQTLFSCRIWCTTQMLIRFRRWFQLFLLWMLVLRWKRSSISQHNRFFFHDFHWKWLWSKYSDLLSRIILLLTVYYYSGSNTWIKLPCLPHDETPKINIHSLISFGILSQLSFEDMNEFW